MFSIQSAICRAERNGHPKAPNMAQSILRSIRPFQSRMVLASHRAMVALKVLLRLVIGIVPVLDPGIQITELAEIFS
jgi:hypothetical protein